MFTSMFTLTFSATEISTKLDEISEENATLNSTIDRLKNKMDLMEKQQLRIAELLENLNGPSTVEKRPSFNKGKHSKSTQYLPLFL